ncbi:hypothetical protein ACHAWO_013917 [Cyclotella atomus]|uniref:Uncharacterized protein n=1 Tax=Cyclotella atomus TaxID=382360 RepID=A0ABD3PVR4_9STRA
MSKPQRKPGFKGKTARKKFTRTVKTGADQKNSRTREAYLEAVASGAAPPTNEDDDVVLAATSRAAAGAGRTTKAKLKSALLLSNKKLKQADQSKDKEERKRSHAETKLASATEAVHAARQEARESKKEQKRTAVELKRTEMALDMERARHDEDIRIAVDQTKAAERSFASNDKRCMQQLFDKQLSATEEHYEKRIKNN